MTCAIPFRVGAARPDRTGTARSDNRMSDQTSRSTFTDYTELSDICEDCSAEGVLVASDPDSQNPDLQEVAEQLALVLTNLGLQRMTARARAALLFA
jgi:hypothetical protein